MNAGITIVREEVGAHPKLPEPLPAGEQIVWQGAPDWRALARHAYWIRVVAVYFAAILAWRVGALAMGGGSAAEIVSATAWTLLPASLALPLLALFAWLQAGATRYTLTDRRIVIQLGVALPLSINLPLAKISAVDRVLLPGGHSDFALTIEGGPPVGYVLLWPHVRLGARGNGCRPVLRCLAGADELAALITSALTSTLSSPASVAQVHVLPGANRARSAPGVTSSPALAS